MQDRLERSGASFITFFWLIGFLFSPAASFGPYFTAIPSYKHCHINIKPSRTMLFESIVEGGEFCDFGEEDLQVSGVVIEDLSWRVHKLRLEEENKKRFLKAKPRFLPYEECRKWVQAFSRWGSEKEWKNWIAEGEKRNSYIPSRPDEYYSNTGDWISWDHFLGTQSNGSSDTNKE